MNKIYTKMFSKIKETFEEEFIIIFIISFLNYIPYGIPRYFWGKYSEFSLIIKILKICIQFIDFFFVSFSIAVLLSFFNKKIKKIVLNIILFFSTLLFFIEALLLKLFNSNINETTIQILMETNKNEAIEFIKTYCSKEIIIFFCSGVILFLLFVLKLKK